MAERRMFSNKITQSDAFLTMPASSQNLYFHLSMDADDEGFVNRPKAIMRMVNANEDDMNILILKKFIIPFDVKDNNSMTNMIIVIKHWFIHNRLRKDRLTPTNHLEQKNLLIQNENLSYSLVNSGSQPNVNQVSTKCLPSVLECSVLECIEEECSGLSDKSEKPSSSVKDVIPYSEIIKYLNDKSDKRFRNIESHKFHIRARWNEGYRIEEFKKVIDNKVHSWLGDSTADSWLRPKTLFGPKFDDYLNEKIMPKKDNSIRSQTMQPIYSELEEDEDDEERELLRQTLIAEQIKDKETKMNERGKH